MSTKRLLLITLFGVLFIVALVSLTLLLPNFGDDGQILPIPEPAATPPPPAENQQDDINRIEITRENVQAVVSALERPQEFSREVVVENFWDGGQSVFHFNVSVHSGVTSIISTPQQDNGRTRRVIVAQNYHYIWYEGEDEPFIGTIDFIGDPLRIADEWHMLFTYEDLLTLDASLIIDAGITEFEGEYCIFVIYESPLLGMLRTYYISITHGLVVAVSEYNQDGIQVYRMSSGSLEEVDMYAFLLPDGTSVVHATV
jgi:hypothetical protein